MLALLCSLLLTILSIVSFAYIVLSVFEFKINFFNEKKFQIKNEAGNIIVPNFKKKLSNMGMVRDNHTGDLIIEFNIKYPPKITAEQAIKISKILDNN